jgi:hypothetical protein
MKVFVCMGKGKRIRWVPFTEDSSQRVPIRLEKEFATRTEGIGLAAWLQNCTERLAADRLRLVRIAKRKPRVGRWVIEQCLPSFWQLPEHDDVHRQILERDQDKKWQYALISTGATAEPKKASSQETDPVPQRGWCSLSHCLRYVAAVPGKPEDAWPEVKNAISDGQLRARGTYFGIDHQPLQPEWMRIAMWDDANDDAIFFRREKGNDLVPPQHVPGHITNVEVSTADIERLWPANTKEAAMSSPMGMESVAGAGSKPASRSIDRAQQGTRGPKQGTVDRYGEADCKLYDLVLQQMILEREEHFDGKWWYGLLLGIGSATDEHTKCVAAEAPDIGNPGIPDNTVVDQMAEWIFAKHPKKRGEPPRRYIDLRDEAQSRNWSAAFKEASFKKAYRKVYQSENHKPPKSGWPLRDSYKNRLDSESEPGKG